MEAKRSKFGNFIILVSGDKYSRKPPKREHDLIMISEAGESDDTVTDSGDTVTDSGDAYWPWVRLDDGGLNHLGPSKVLKVEEDQLVLKLESLGVPSRYESFYIFKEIVGSCNGLVYLYNRSLNEVCLWNPVTKTDRILPNIKRLVEDDGKSPCNIVVGFGLDFKTNVYKVVLLNQYRSMVYLASDARRPECLCKIQTYNLWTDCWSEEEVLRSLPGDPFPYPNKGSYLNGRFFFLANMLLTKRELESSNRDRLIMSFDFATKTFHDIQIPVHEKEDILYLSCLGNKLAMFTKSPTSKSKEDFHFWVWENEDNKMFWKHLHTFEIVRPNSPRECNFPIGISEDERFALLKTVNDSTGFGLKIKLYNFATGEVKSFLSCNAVMFKAYAYKPSNASIMGGAKEAAEAKTKAEAEVAAKNAKKAATAN